MSKMSKMYFENRCIALLLSLFIFMTCFVYSDGSTPTILTAPVWSANTKQAAVETIEYAEALDESTLMTIKPEWAWPTVSESDITASGTDIVSATEVEPEAPVEPAVLIEKPEAVEKPIYVEEVVTDAEAVSTTDAPITDEPDVSATDAPTPIKDVSELFENVLIKSEPKAPLTIDPRDPLNFFHDDVSATDVEAEETPTVEEPATPALSDEERTEYADIISGTDVYVTKKYGDDFAYNPVAIQHSTNLENAQGTTEGYIITDEAGWYVIVDIRGSKTVISDTYELEAIEEALAEWLGRQDSVMKGVTAKVANPIDTISDEALMWRSTIGCGFTKRLGDPSKVNELFRNDADAGELYHDISIFFPHGTKKEDAVRACNETMVQLHTVVYGFGLNDRAETVSGSDTLMSAPTWNNEYTTLAFCEWETLEITKNTEKNYDSATIRISSFDKQTEFFVSGSDIDVFSVGAYDEDIHDVEIAGNYTVADDFCVGMANDEYSSVSVMMDVSDICSSSDVAPEDLLIAVVPEFTGDARVYSVVNYMGKNAYAHSFHTDGTVVYAELFALGERADFFVLTPVQNENTEETKPQLFSFPYSRLEQPEQSEEQLVQLPTHPFAPQLP